MVWVLKASKRGAEVWCHERLIEAVGIGATLVVVKSPGLKGSWEKTEAWHDKKPESHW